MKCDASEIKTEITSHITSEQAQKLFELWKFEGYD